MTIPDVRKPGPYSEITEGSSQGLPSNLQEMLIVAQRTSAGSVDAHIPTRIYSPAQARHFSNHRM